MKRLITLACVSLFALVVAATASAARLEFEGAAKDGPGYVTLVSNTADADAANDASSVRVVNSGVTTFSSLKTLGAQYNVTDDGCGGGSPRFQIAFGDKNAFVYLGTPPSFTGCTEGRWVGTGNLLRSSDARFDLSQLGGAQQSTYQQALALLTSQTVSGISLVVDSGWFFGDKEQTVLVRNVRVNSSLMARGYSRMAPSALCREQSAALGVAAFDQLWTASQWRANAFARCTSGMARAQRFGLAARVQADLSNAIASCKTERAASASEFRAKYATRNGGQAFARCVASKADAARAFLALKVNAKKLATKRP
jgi:hypothetical protein